MVLVVLILVVGSAALLSPTRPPSGQPPTDVPSSELDPYAQPIYDADEAVARTLAALPMDITVTQVAARLVSSSTLQAEWTEDDVTSWIDDAPLWLVGVVADGLEVGEVTQVIPGMQLVEDSDVVPGAYMVWNANSGTLLLSGGLEPHTAYNATAVALGTPTIEPGPGYDFRMEKLLQIPADPLAVSPATSIP